MKKKLIALLLVTVSVISLLCSCGDDGDGTGDGGESNGSTNSENQSQGGNSDSTGATDGAQDSDVLYQSGSQINIVCAAAGSAVQKLSSKLRELGVNVQVVSDSTAAAEHEIVIGKSSREISESAYRRLGRIELENPSYVGYTVYSDGKSVAIAYHEDIFGLEAAKTVAIEYFISEIIGNSSTLTLKKGNLISKPLDPIEYQEQLDAIEEEKKWANFIDKVSALTDNAEEIAASIKNYYDTVCTDNVISWFANLYDPQIGGYYYSNSGRDNEGFLPDAESTSQALGVWQSSGMANINNGSLIGTIPEWMRLQIIAFLKGLQDPKSGYFYHPQWTKEEVDSHLNRRARDLSKSVSALKSLGSAPTYDTPSGVKGDGIRADGSSVLDDSVTVVSQKLTARLGGSAAIAASKVVSVSSAAVASHLVDDESFKAYLAECLAANSIPKGQSGHRSFYAIGNEIGSQSDQIVARDAQLAAAGAKYSLGDILLDWYTEHQNKETGLWDEGLSYDTTNALLKICGTYTTFGRVFPNVEKAMQSCIAMLTSPEKVEATVYVYNVWMSLGNLMTNLEKMAPPSEAALVKEVRATLLEMAPEAIDISAQKQLTFKKLDGSFSYTPTASASTSQGMKVAVPYTDEGDVNATVICMGGTINNCLEALGIKHFTPSFFTNADRLRYIYILEGLGPVIKNDSEYAVDYLTFDYDSVGNIPSGNISASLKSGSLTVAEDTYGNTPGNKAAEFKTVSGYSENVKISSQSGALNASCFVFESDLNVLSSDETYTMQILMQPAVYMLGLRVSDGRVHVWESSSTGWAFAKETDLGVSAKLGEWFNIKIEYYVGDHDSVRIKLYFNGELVAITDNYFDNSGNNLSGTGTPVTTFDYVNIIGMKDYNVTLLMDNVAAYKTDSVYRRPDVSDPQPYINVDPPDRSSLVYDFNDEAIDESFEVLAGDAQAPTVKVNPVTGSPALLLSGVPQKTKKDENNKDVATTPSSVYVPINVRGGGAKCIVLECDVTVDTASEGTVLRAYFREARGDKNDTVCFDLTTEKYGTQNYVRLTEAANGVPSANVESIRIPINTSFKLRLEYYENELATLIYVNDTLLGMSGTVCNNANKYSTGLLELTGAVGSSYSTYIDNLRFERAKLSFSSAATPPTPEVKHQFTGSDSMVTLSGGARIDRASAKLSAKGNELKVIATDRSDVYSSTHYSSLVTLGSGSDGIYRFTLHAEDGKAITSFELVRNKKKVILREYYAGGAGTELSSTDLKTQEFTLSFNYYHSRNITAVYINGSCVGVNTLTYSYENEKLKPAYVTVMQTDGSSVIYLDDVVIENLLGVYKKSKISGAIKGDGNDMTFEESYRDNLPTGIVDKAASTDYQLDVKGVKIGEKEDGTPIYSKFLAFRTGAGGNDSLTFNMAESLMLSNAKAAVFEADVLFDGNPISGNATVEFYFGNSSGSVWRVSLTFNDGKSLKANDWKSPSLSINKDIASEGELIKLRIEYTNTDDGGVAVNFFVNGVYKCTSTRLYSDTLSTDVSEINLARFYATNAAVGTILLDNVKLYHSDSITSTETEAPPEGGETPPEGGETPPEGGETPPEGGETPPEGGETPPEGGDDDKPTPPILPEEDGGFDNIGKIPDKPDDAPLYDGSGWTH